ncbi:MAG: LysM peptidoglycan-binding domain-containing protein [Bacteroidetes bacterium]|nr:LysM peptidoglycan-binding domain-containing protein [Bacteroidota bacterium]
MQSTAKTLLLFLLLMPVYFSINAQQEPVSIIISKEKAIIDGKTYYLHTVKQGETLFSISKAYNTPQKEIIAANPEAATTIKIGKILRIPTDMAPKLPPSLNSEAYIFHIVENGQTIFSIAEKYSISKEELYKHNPETEISPLQTGQVIKIPKNTNQVASSDTQDSPFIYRA